MTFPESALETTVGEYPMLNKAKLKTELSLIYENPEFRVGSGAVPLYQFFIENNLQSTFTETVSLLKIIITTPMTTAESERCFSTLKRIKTLLRNTMTQDRLNALAMLSRRNSSETFLISIRKSLRNLSIRRRGEQNSCTNKHEH